MAVRPAILLPPKRLLTPRSARRVSTTNRGLLLGAPGPTQTGLTPASSMQLSGRTMPKRLSGRAGSADRWRDRSACGSTDRPTRLGRSERHADPVPRTRMESTDEPEPQDHRRNPAPACLMSDRGVSRPSLRGRHSVPSDGGCVPVAHPFRRCVRCRRVGGARGSPTGSG